MTPDRAADAAAIAYTQSVYATEGDRGKLDGLASAFLPDGILEFGGTAHQGHEAIKASLSAGTDESRRAAEGGTRVFLRHNLTTRRIEFDGPDAATVWTYFLVMSPRGLDHTGRYIDRFVRSGDRWLIAHRRVSLDWAAAESPQRDAVG
ncbi:MAG TPA: nuclear transport factor 2 family protein [Amycolatopsis sp.]|nr:nuclear transport factor 2 family protein [Amycolatopsis sp.]